MKRAAILALAAFSVWNAPSLLAAKPEPLKVPTPQQMAAVKAQLLSAPWRFEENRGQAPAEFDYLSRGDRASVYLRSNEAKVVLFDKKGSVSASLKLEGAAEKLKPVAQEPLEGTVNYLKGKDPAKWVKEVPTSGRIKYEGVYPGVDVVYYGSRQRLEYDFVLAPHADPNAICWKAEGMDSVKVNGEGALLLGIAGREVAIQKPVAYQMEAGSRKYVEANYRVEGSNIRFALHDYDASKPLVIDPVVQFIYSTYLGGTIGDSVGAIAIDRDENIYLTGWTLSTDFPVTSGALKGAHELDSNKDVFVTKLRKVTVSGSTAYTIAFATYLGGTSSDEATGIALDPNGSIYVVGNTRSTDFTPSNFPSLPPSSSFNSQPFNAGGVDGFAVKLSNNGSTLLYSTYFGTAADEVVKGVAVNSAGEAVIGGQVASGDFYGYPTSAPGQQPGTFSLTLIVTTTTQVISEKTASIPIMGRLSQAGAIEQELNNLNLVQSSGTDAHFSVTPIDGMARKYRVEFNKSIPFRIVAEGSDATNLNVGLSAGIGKSNDSTSDHPVWILSLGVGSGISDACLLRLTSAGLIDESQSVIIGGGGQDSINAVAVDLNGGTYIAGQTDATIGGRTQTVPFVAKVTRSTVVSMILADPTKKSPLYDTGWASAVAVDLSGNVYAVGTTQSQFFPVYNAFQTYPQTLDLQAPADATGSGFNAFVAKLDPTMSSIVFATYLGGSKLDYGYGIAVDSRNYVYVTGRTESAGDFPILGGAANQSSDHLHGNAFLSILVPAGNALRYSTYFGGAETEEGLALAVTPGRSPIAYVGGYTLSDDFPTTRGSLFDTSLEPDTYTSGFVTAFQDTSVDLQLESITSDVAVPVPGQPITLTVTVKNLSTVDAAGARVWQTLSDSLEFVSAEGPNITNFSGGSLDTTTKDLVANLGAVLAGREVSYRIVVRPTGPQVLSTTATIQAEFDETSSNNSYTLQLVARPVVSLAVTQAKASESGSNGIFTVSRAGDLSQALTVPYTVGGTAINGVDYETLPGSVVLPAGVASAEVVVHPLADIDFAEGQETVTLQVGAGSDYELGTLLTGVVTIDDVGPNVVNVNTTDGDASETGDPGAFTVSRTGEIGNSLTVLYTLNGTAVNGVNYALLSGTAVIPANTTSANIVVSPILAYSGTTTTVTFNLAPGSAYISGTSTTGTVEIAGVSKNTVSVVSTIPDASEEGTNGAFRILRSGDISNPLTVQYIMSGKAVNGTDYELLPGTVTIPANAASVDLPLTPIVDTLTEGSEDAKLTLSSAQTYLLGEVTAATVNLADFTGAVVNVVATDTAADEAGDPGVFTFTRSGSTKKKLVVKYTMGGTAVNGLDYKKLSGKVTIPAKKSSVTVKLVPKADNLPGDNETATVELLAGANYVRGTDRVATVTIQDLDLPTVSISAGSTTSVYEGHGSLQVIFTRSIANAPALKVAYDLGGSAKSGKNYKSVSGTITIPAGAATARLTLKTVHDEKLTPDLTVTVTAKKGKGYLVEGEPVSLTIMDIDLPDIHL